MNDTPAKKNKDLVTIALPGAAIAIGGVMLLVCLITPFWFDFLERDVTALIQLVAGFYGVLFVAMGIAAKWQRRLRARLAGTDET